MVNLFLKESQVLAGMTVVLCKKQGLKRELKPIEDEKGRLVLRALMGGVPVRRKFYPVDGGIEVHDNKHGRVVIATSLEKFKPNIWFLPQQIFSPDNAPPCTDFAVFVNGEQIKYDDGRDNKIYVCTDETGHILSSNGYEYLLFKRQISLPKDALLVPITEIGEYKDAEA